MSDFRKVLVGTAVAAAVAAGGLVGAGTAFAAPEPVATNQEAVALAVDNLGLSTGEAKSVQRFLIYKHYDPGTVDGQLGSKSWMAMQSYLSNYGYGYKGTIDGIVGPQTIKALQRRLAAGFGYTGAIDGIAGPETRFAFEFFANSWT
ncbi:peptidoglycan-binding protein [Amycolatopsis sp. NPDC088138]|uniref:peptidoglycan-binding domain-containing protein n=1 Tax=Amycolatopsis sp. NPDC088138 TaxID=3363938 RepID=UPI00381799C5